MVHVIDSGGLYGTERMLLDLASEHLRLGHAPLIVSITSRGRDEKPLDRAARSRGVPIESVALSPRADPRSAWRLLRLLRERGADVVHSHGCRANMLLGLVPGWCRPVPLVATVHGNLDPGGWTRNALYHRVNHLALRRADRVVLVHAAMAATRGLNHLGSRRWRVIENGIADASPAPVAYLPDRSADLDDEIVQFCTGRTVIGAIGRLTREKGFDILLRAVAELAPARRNVVVVIFGEGKRRRQLEHLIAELDLHGRVRLPGYRHNASAYLRLFTLFALPSLTEGLPLVVLEAMQAGVPVVATRVGGIPDLLDEGRAGMLADPGHSGDLASALRCCLDDPALATRLAARARTRQDSRFTSHGMALRYLDLYHELTTRS